MFHMPYSLLVFFLLCNPDHVVGRIILPREALPKRAPNISTSTSAAQTYNRSQVTPSASLLASYWDPDPPPLPTGASLVSEYNARFVATTMPPPFFPHPSDNNDQLRKNYADIRSGICRPSDSFCQFQASGQPLISAQDKAFDDQCVLWNDDCSGNRTFAIEKFFKDISYRNPQNILNNHCFNQDSLANLEDCDDYNPPDRLKLWQEMKAWMRSPECVSAQHEYSIVEDATPINASSDNLETCCGSCGLLAQNVDLFYWPNPDEEDVSCLSIVGNSVLPLDYGATTAVQSLPSPMFTKNLSTTYWACPAHRTTGLSYPPAGGSTSITYFDSYATTARITTIGSVTVKVPLYNPWSSSPCMETKAAPLYSNSSTAIGDTNASIYPHGNVPVNPSASIYPSSNLSVIPSSITQPNSLPVSTVVSGTVTFTSPSIYAIFYGLHGVDGCGTSAISSTMLSFPPGELSTIEGPLSIVDDHQVLSTKSFNMNDLPCPPQSVMEANWYKPQPGEPYRPLIAMPSQIKQLAPWFKYCTDSFFTALDPPRALNPVSDLGPSDPKTPASVPVPSPTRTLLAEHSDHGASPSPTPAISAIVDQPKATSNPAVDPTTESSNADPLSNDRGSQLFPPSLRPTLTTASEDANHGDDTNQGSNANQNNDFNQSNDPNQSSDSKQNNDTNQGSNPNQNNDPKENNDPNQGSDPSNGEDPSEGGNHNQVSDPGQGSTVTGDSGLGEKSSQPSLPLQTGSADQGPAGSDQIVDSGNTVPANGGLGHDPTGASPPKSSSPESGSKAAAPLLVVPNPLTTPTEGSTLTEGQVASINNQQVQQLSQGISIAGTTLTPGAPPITVASTLISFGSAALVVGTSTVPFASETPRKIVTTIAGQVLTVAPTAITFAGTTLSPGVAGAGVDGTIVSLDSAGQFIVGSQKIPLLSSSLSRTITTTIAGQPITAAPNAVAIAGSTLTAGASGTTLSGTPVSLNAAGQLVVGSKTVPLDSDSESSRTITTTIGDRQVITAAPTGVAFAGTTLRPGASGVTINDTLVSLNTAGQLVLGSTTVTLQSKDTGLGGLIIGGFGPGGPVVDPTSSVQRNVSSGFGNGTGAGGPVFEGKAGGLRWCLWWEKVVLPMLATVIMMCIY